MNDAKHYIGICTLCQGEIVVGIAGTMKGKNYVEALQGAIDLLLA